MKPVFHKLYFKRSNDEIRELTISTNEYRNNALYYYINNGKPHYEQPTKYISDIMKKGWRKISFKEYVHLWYEKTHGRTQMKNWVRCDIPKETAGRFKEYLRDNRITYETSENGNDIHFECRMNIDEQISANAFISERC